ncbi:hypothetical protein [Empedobacter brevis]|uniref:hypothetical protein n=1 Tax=Empedobacter brevis TaxID=247 RepID=UPI00289FB5DD|nr:hypothetical protein [Empedobacter brevis]
MKNLNLPISLDYSTTGVRVNAISGRVGTGWVLNIGNISLNRDVRGVADNVVEELKLDKKYFEFQPNDDNPATSGANGDYTLATKLTGVSRSTVINAPSLDANKDYFIYSLNSNSGRFIQDSQGEFHTIPKDDVKILNTKTLIDNQGNAYYFTEYANISNFNMYANIDDIGVSMPFRNTSFAFKLDSIKLPTNEVIQFKYETDNYNFTSSFNKSLDLKTDSTDKNPLKPCKSYEDSPSVTRSYQQVTDQVIKEIIYPNGKITFDYASNNQEVIGGKVLKNVKFYQNNQLYKNYNLESDFTTSTTPSQMIPQYKEENLSKRLFLFKVNESLTNANYSFNYYGVDKTSLKTSFPSRFSGKEDYWGNYSSAGDFLPSSNKYVNKSGVLTSYEGANKNPRLNDAIIGSMESIQLPTGGFQQIKYELDDFYDEGYKEYYEEVKNEGLAVSHAEAINKVTKSITINEKNWISNAKFSFNYPGIENVDYSEDPPSLPTVSHYYVEISINGKKWKSLFNKIEKSLELHEMIRNGDVITFKFHYEGKKGTPLNSGATIGLSYTVEKEREIPFVYRTAGNLRVQELVLKENANTETYKKQYTYKKFDQPDEPSGYFLGRDMNMNYYTRKPFNNPAITQGTEKDLYCEYLNVSSQNNFNLYALENKSIVYPNVTEKIINLKDNSFYTIEKEFSVPDKKAYSEHQLPFIQGSYNGYMGGLLKNETYKNDKGSIVRSVTNIYEFDNYFNQFSSKYDNAFPGYLYPAMDLNIRSSYSGSVVGMAQEYFTFDINTYYYPSTWIKLKEIKEVDFFENKQFIEKIKTFNYNYNQIKPISEVTTTSKGENITTEYQYPPDLIGQEDYMTELKEANRISEPVVVKQKVDGTYISEVHNQYNLFNGIIQKSVVHQKKGSGIDINKTDDRKVIYSSYDNRGNLTQYALQNGISVAIIWGYNGQYPIAKIEGAAYSEVSAYISDLETKSNDGSLAKESFNTLRTAFPHAMITTYVYQPLVGVTSITTPNGQTEYYKYDASNRLEEIRNDKKEMIKTFKYKYKQP